MRVFLYVLLTMASIYGAAYLCFPMFLSMMVEHKMVKPNYRQEEIPSMFGIFFVLLMPLCCVIQLFWSYIFEFGAIADGALLLLMGFYCMLFIGFALIGMLDDLLGDNERKGFKGHFTAMFKEKKLTSGALKAIAGSFLALFFAIAANVFRLTFIGTSSSFFAVYIAIDFLLLVLATNMMNLFDLRPGRAVKAFFLFFVIIMLFALFDRYEFWKLGLLMFLPIFALLLFYFPLDLKAKVMLGDTGSNPLGATLGVMMILLLPNIWVKLFFLVLLIALHLLAERYSFTEFIANNKVLRIIDEWGRDVPPIVDDNSEKAEGSSLE